MELTAIYHRPESEYAYLYKDGQLHIRIRTKKEDVKRIVLHYGDPFIFIEDLYEATKEMDKVTTDDLFDYWQVSVSVRHARIQYLFELEDTAGEKILYGDRGVAAYTKENLDFVMNGFKLPFIHEIDGCAVPDWVAQTVWYQIFPERFANGNPAISPEGIRTWDASIAPTMLDFFGGDLQGIIDHLDYLQELGITGLYLCPIFESPSNHKYDTIDYFKIDQHFGDKETFRKLVQEAHARGMKIMLSLTILAMIHPNGRMWSNTGRIRFTRIGSILKSSLSPQKICGIVATCLTMLLPLRAICLSSIRLIQRLRPIS